MSACKAEVSGGGRCRNAAGANGFCSSHPEDSKVAGRPDKVLLKANINPKWAQRFIALGIPVKKPDFAKREADHVAHAQDHGRQAYAVRKDIANSGVPVFGKEGATCGVSVVQLIDELSAEMRVTDVHLFQKSMERDPRGVMSTLVVTFAKEGKEVIPPAVLDFFGISKWGFAHIWANPPKDGVVVHTVNLAHRADEKAEHELRFADGLWAI